LVKNILYIFGSVLIFFTGLILYGIILNIREIPLKEAMTEKGIGEIKEPKLVVDRKNYRIELYDQKQLIKTYKAVFGKSNSDIKTSKDDFVTPVGDYKICSIDTLSKYHKFLKINYPNLQDAAEAFARKYITKDEFGVLMSSIKKDECPQEGTSLGSNIGIHGIGKYDLIFRNLPFTFNWTNGSVAVSNANIDELFSVVKIGTPVIITR
jgi:murein L,D-transpeptidase YafK